MWGVLNYLDFPFIGGGVIGYLGPTPLGDPCYYLGGGYLWLIYILAHGSRNTKKTAMDGPVGKLATANMNLETIMKTTQG